MIQVIVLSGPIGAGKSSLTSNIYLLNHRLAQINQAVKEKNSVSDRSIYEDALFFQMNAESNVADPTEFKIYDSLLENMMEDTPGNPSKKPDLLIYIRVSLDTMLKRIEKRGRSYEQISTDPSLKDYYARLIRYYEPWYEKYDASPKIVIDGDKYDFIGDEDAKKEVLSQIDSKLREIGSLE